jgi:periplasmic mercuric ion binding protein
MKSILLVGRTAWRAARILSLVALVAALPPVEQAQAQTDKYIETPDVVIEVGGLACPFCAYGIEKRLHKIDELAELSVLLEEGKVQLKVKEGETVSSERLRKAIADAGFEAKSIVFLNPDAETQPGT